MFKVIIAGSRTFNNYELLKNKADLYLKNIIDNIEIVSGEARGADKLGERYAKERKYKLKQFAAPWDEIEGKPNYQIGITKNGKKYWRGAGYFRNVQMAEYANALIAFQVNNSNGTANMIEEAKKRNLKMRIIKF